MEEETLLKMLKVLKSIESTVEDIKTRLDDNEELTKDIIKSIENVELAISNQS